MLKGMLILSLFTVISNCCVGRFIELGPTIENIELEAVPEGELDVEVTWLNYTRKDKQSNPQEGDRPMYLKKHGTIVPTTADEYYDSTETKSTTYKYINKPNVSKLLHKLSDPLAKFNQIWQALVIIFDMITGQGKNSSTNM